MSKKVVIFVLILLVVFMGAECGKKKEESKGPFLGGTDGILMSFKEASPTDSFQQDDAVPIKVIIENKGEFDLKEGDLKVRLFGLNLEDFNLANAGNYIGLTSNLRGADKEFFPEGGRKELSLGELKYQLNIIGELEEHTLRARACHPYQTNSVVDVCIKSKLLQETGEGICSIEGEKIETGDVSKAPVQVTSIIEEPRGRNQIKFNVKIENLGAGTVYSIDDDCQALEENSIKKLDSKDKVKISVTNPTGVKCGPEESSEVEVILKNNEYNLVCWKEADEVYETKLNMKLNYLYASEISKKLTIYSIV